MRHVCRYICYILLLGAAFADASAAVDSADSVSGVVRDAKHLPLANVSVTLQERDHTNLHYKATSDQSGIFRFPAVAGGEYTLSAEGNGFRPSAPVMLHIDSSPIEVTVDLLPKASTPPPQFQSSGIRGLIDPGGYSASSDGAASDLLRGMAQLKRADGQAVAAPAQEVPCSAEPALREALAAHPDDAEAHRRLGLFYALHDQPSAAIPLLRKALQIDPQNVAATTDLAALYLQTEDFNQARSLIEPFAAKSSQLEVHRILARADEGAGFFSQAAEQYRVADKEDPSPQSAFGIGYELLLSGSRNAALAAFEAGVQRYPQSIPLRLGVGIAQMLSGNSAAALDSFLAATDIHPSDPRPYPFVVKAFQVSGSESERALDSLQRFVTLAPNNADALSMDALILSRLGGSHSEQIDELLTRAIALNPSLAAAHLELADQYEQQGQYASAIPEYETALSLDSRLREALYRLALAYKRTGQPERSKREMQRFRLTANQDHPDTQIPAADGTSLSQFISVMHASSGRTVQSSCP